MEGEPGFKDWSTATRVTAIVDHGILMPLTLIYSFFVPLSRGNWWLYHRTAGLCDRHSHRRRRVGRLTPLHRSRSR